MSLFSQVDHIGVAVRSLEETMPLYRDIFGFAFDGAETAPDGLSRVAFFKCGEVNFELLEPVHADTPIGKFLEKRGEGLHHVCLRVSDIDEARRRLTEAGLVLIDEKPRLGAHQKLISFFHPKSTHGVLTEIAMLQKHLQHK